MNALRILMVILLIQYCRADIDTDLFDRCFEEKVALREVSHNCHDQIPYVDDFTTEVKTAMGPDGDTSPNNIIRLSKKFCTVAEHAIDCRVDLSQLDEPCRSYYQVDIAGQKIELNLLKSLRNYACQNDSRTLIDFLQNNGTNVMTQLPTCNVKDIIFADPRHQTFRINPDYCDGIQRRFVCFADLVNNHSNANLSRIVREVYDIVVKELQC